MESSNKCKIMISGANGFLGKNLLLHLSKNYNVRPITVRSSNLTKIKKEITQFQPDIFINNGWYAGNKFNDVNSYEQFDNLNIIFELSKTLSELKNLYYIGIGSFAEYGVKSTISKEVDEGNPNNYYGASKNMFKTFSETFCKINNFKWLWLRPCYIYGQYDIPNRLIPKVIDAFENNKKLTLNSCNSIVDYLYVDDFTLAVENLISSNCHGVFNVCSGDQYKIKDIINEIKDIYSINIDINFNSLKDRKNSYTNYICGDNSKLLKMTSWKPKFNLRLGLRKTINSYKKSIYAE